MTKKQRGITLKMLLATLALGSSTAIAQSEAMECVSDRQDEILCLALPVGSQERDELSRMNEASAVAARPRKLRMLTASDATGGEVSIETETEIASLLENGSDVEMIPAAGTLATRQAFRTQDKIKQIEVFLDLTERTGGTGDLTRISVGKPTE